MEPTRIEESEEGTRYIFEKFRRRDFVENALVIYTDAGHRVRRLHFNSADLGTVELDSRQGLVACNSWESEESAQSASYLSRRFPIILHNGSENADFARHIMREVLERIDNEYITRLVEEFCLAASERRDVALDRQFLEI